MKNLTIYEKKMENIIKELNQKERDIRNFEVININQKREFLTYCMTISVMLIAGLVTLQQRIQKDNDVFLTLNIDIGLLITFLIFSGIYLTLLLSSEGKWIKDKLSRIEKIKREAFFIYNKKIEKNFDLYKKLHSIDKSAQRVKWLFSEWVFFCGDFLFCNSFVFIVLLLDKIYLKGILFIAR